MNAGIDDPNNRMMEYVCCGGGGGGDGGGLSGSERIFNIAAELFLGLFAIRHGLRGGGWGEGEVSESLKDVV